MFREVTGVVSQGLFLLYSEVCGSLNTNALPKNEEKVEEETARKKGEKKKWKGRGRRERGGEGGEEEKMMKEEFSQTTTKLRSRDCAWAWRRHEEGT